MENNDGVRTIVRDGEVIELIPRGKKIKVMPDILAGGGVWLCDDGGPQITPEELGASPELCLALYKWGDWYDRKSVDRTDLAYRHDAPDFKDLDEARRFDERGLELAQWLKREVGDDYIVIYRSVILGGPVSDISIDAREL